MRRPRTLGVVGAGLLLLALPTLAGAVFELSRPDYLAAILLTLMGLSLLHAAVELLRPIVGD